MNKPAKRTTQTDIASALGVTQSMVSREFTRLGIVPAPDGSYSTADIVALAQDRVRGRPSSRREQTPDELKELIEKCAELAVVPQLIKSRSIWILITVAAHKNGLPKELAAQMYISAVCGLSYAAADACRDPESFAPKVQDGCLFDTACKAKRAGTLAAWAEANWPARIEEEEEDREAEAAA